jgi:hypothetical protein|tara:strand:+ start:1541 stop:1777 length:237 start_codon:yes stop_codon:yes gene_type:complete
MEEDSYKVHHRFLVIDYLAHKSLACDTIGEAVEYIANVWCHSMYAKSDIEVRYRNKLIGYEVTEPERSYIVNLDMKGR